jgi:hypothetical protein
MTRRYEVLEHVVGALAEVEGRAPPDIDYSLYEHIEPDALVTLVESEHADWQLTFSVPGHTVEVRGSGQILVDGTVVRELEAASTEA